MLRSHRFITNSTTRVAALIFGTLPSELMPSMRMSSMARSGLLGQNMSVAKPVVTRMLPGGLVPRGGRLITGRTFASSPNDLKSLLIKESEHEKSTYVPEEEVQRGPPEPFTLTEAKGDTLMTLTRAYGNGETVMVDVMTNDQGDEEPVIFEDEDGEVDVDVSVDFVVSIVKSNAEHELVFECCSDGSYIEIKKVSLDPVDDDEDLDEALYTGPETFEELDEAVQDAMYQYLEERGITAELGEYLLHLTNDKEQREYMDWLERMAHFL